MARLLPVHKVYNYTIIWLQGHWYFIKSVMMLLSTMGCNGMQLQTVLTVCFYMYTINHKSCAREKFRGLANNFWKALAINDTKSTKNFFA